MENMFEDEIIDIPQNKFVCGGNCGSCHENLDCCSLCPECYPDDNDSDEDNKS